MRFDPLTFLEKLAALVLRTLRLSKGPTPRRAHLVTFHGILAPNAAYRDYVVPRPDSGSRTGPLRRHRGGSPPPDEDEGGRRRRLSWAELLQRVFHIDALECPYCGAQRKLIALITDPSLDPEFIEGPVVRDILVCIGLDPDPPTRAPPRIHQAEFESHDIPA